MYQPTEKTLKDLSSFIIQPYRRKFLHDYYQRMGKDNLGMLWDDNVANVLQEQGFEIEQSPRSVYRVEKLFEALAKYAPEREPIVNLMDEHVMNGVRLAYACFGCKDDADKLEIEEFTPEFILSITSNLQASAGLTAYGMTKHESYLHAYERGMEIIQSKKRPEPCLAFKRTQFNDKTRLVWGYPYSMTAIEGIFARPLIDKFLGGSSPMSFGMPDGVLGTKLRVSSYSNEFAYSLDVSSFDASVSAQLIRQAFFILATWFRMDDKVAGVRASDVWAKIVQYFIHTPIVMPDGMIYKGKKHGVPSGSYFTQMIDSIVNTIMVGAISSRFSLNVGKETISVLGDDILFWSNRKVSLNAISQYATSVFSAKFNVEKSHLYRFDEPIQYLGRVWTKGIPDLPEPEILKRMVQPESFRRYSPDPEEREAQVILLIASYAATYLSANPIYWKAVHKGKKWNVDVKAYELAGYKSHKSGRERNFELDPNFLSGLQRFQRKYGGVSELVGGTPLALRFWK